MRNKMIDSLNDSIKNADKNQLRVLLDQCANSDLKIEEVVFQYTRDQNIYWVNLFDICFMHRHPELFGWLLSDEITKICPDLKNIPLNDSRSNLSLFARALQCGDIEIVKTVLNAGAPIQRSETDLLPFMKMVEFSNLKVLRWALSEQFKVDCPQVNLGPVDACNPTGWNALSKAIEDNKAEHIKVLLDAGSRLDYVNDKSKKNQLYILASNLHDLETINVVFSSPEKLPNLNSPSNTGSSVLFSTLANNAPAKNVIHFVTKLLQNGADPNPSFSNENLLHYCVMKQCSVLLDYLLTNQLVPQLHKEINALCGLNMTMLMHTLEQDNLATLKILLKHSADLNILYKNTSPLFLAVIKNSTTTLEYLLSDQLTRDFPALTMNAVDLPNQENGKTPLMEYVSKPTACDVGQMQKIILLFLQKGAVTITPAKNNNPRHYLLYHALASGQYNTARWLRCDQFLEHTRNIRPDNDNFAGCYFFGSTNHEQLFCAMVKDYIEEIRDCFKTKQEAITYIEKLLALDYNNMSNVPKQALYEDAQRKGPSLWRIIELLIQVNRNYFVIKTTPLGPAYDNGYNGVSITSVEGRVTETSLVNLGGFMAKNYIPIDTVKPAYTAVVDTLNKTGLPSSELLPYEVSLCTRCLLFEELQDLKNQLVYEQKNQTTIAELQEKIGFLNDTIIVLSRTIRQTDEATAQTQSQSQSQTESQQQAAARLLGQNLGEFMQGVQQSISVDTSDDSDASQHFTAEFEKEIQGFFNRDKK